jgi:hypothetical protein
VRATLLSALCACVADRKKPTARRFLQGLSCDELEYIAEFFGACVLESRYGLGSTRGELAEEITAFECSRRGAAPPGARPDDDHKMILLLEYLCRCGLARFPLPARSV